jgi:hypothetical protein
MRVESAAGDWSTSCLPGQAATVKPPSRKARGFTGRLAPPTPSCTPTGSTFVQVSGPWTCVGIQTGRAWLRSSSPKLGRPTMVRAGSFGVVAHAIADGLLCYRFRSETASVVAAVSSFRSPRSRRPRHRGDGAGSRRASVIKDVTSQPDRRGMHSSWRLAGLAFSDRCWVARRGRGRRRPPRGCANALLQRRVARRKGSWR